MAQCEQCQMNPIRNTISKIDSNGNSILLVYNDTDDILTILPESEIARAELITSEFDDINQITSDETGIVEMSTQEPEEKWPISALKGELKERLPSNVVLQWDNIIGTKNDNNDSEEPVHYVNYIHDREEKKDLLDGTGEGFPTPPAACPEDPKINLDSDPEAWLENVTHSHLSDSQWIKLRNVLIKYRDAFSVGL